MNHPPIAGPPASTEKPLTTHEVLIVDDQRTFADALSLAIDTKRDLRTWASVRSAEEAISLLRSSQTDGSGCPDLVLLDINLPGMDGISAIPQLRDICPGMRIIVITADLTGQSLLAAADAGAHSLLPKDQPFEDVLRAIRDDAGDDTFAASRTLTPVVALARREPADRSRRRSLTEREYEILLLLADGDPVKQIARRLDMSIHTCRGHVSSLLAKLDAHSQLAAVVTAARLGLLPNLHADG